MLLLHLIYEPMATTLIAGNHLTSRALSDFMDLCSFSMQTCHKHLGPPASVTEAVVMGGREPRFGS